MVILGLLLIALLFYWMTVVTGRFFIASLDNISDYLGIPPDIAGATFMAAGTSAPELTTTIIALVILQSGVDFGVGTVIGSAIFQILVVVGVAALMRSSYLHWQPVVRDALIYAAAVLLLLMSIIDGQIDRYDTTAMILLYLGYLIILFFWKKYFPSHWDEYDPLEELEQEFAAAKRPPHRRWRFWYQPQPLRRLSYRIRRILELPFHWIPDCDAKPIWTVPVFIFSLLTISGISFLLIKTAIFVAGGLNIPPTIVALTILASGSALPEMISSAVVAREGRADMAISNAIGSNTYAILIALGLPYFIVTWWKGPIAVDHANVASSIFLLFVTLVVVVGLLIWLRWRITPKFGSFLLFVYVCYVIAAYGGWL